jgi:hypothetical protein
MPDTVTEALTVPDTLADDVTYHRVCVICFPKARSDALDVGPCISVCGKKLLGIVAPPDAEYCGVCAELMYQHWWGHFDRGRP